MSFLHGMEYNDYPEAGDVPKWDYTRYENVCDYDDFHDLLYSAAVEYINYGAKNFQATSRLDLCEYGLNCSRYQNGDEYEYEFTIRDVLKLIDGNVARAILDDKRRILDEYYADLPQIKSTRNA